MYVQVGCVVHAHEQCIWLPAAVHAFQSTWLSGSEDVLHEVSLQPHVCLKETSELCVHDFTKGTHIWACSTVPLATWCITLLCMCRSCGARVTTLMCSCYGG